MDNFREVTQQMETDGREFRRGWGAAALGSSHTRKGN